MRDFAKDALALLESEATNNRSAIVLFPTWKQYGKDWNRMRPLPEGTFVRFSNVQPGLKSLRVDTLIVVLPEECDPHGLLWARHLTCISKDPKYIYLHEEDNDTTYENDL
jgi:hypothetical protein